VAGYGAVYREIKRSHGLYTNFKSPYILTQPGNTCNPKIQNRKAYIVIHHLSPQVIKKMHISDGILAPEWCLVWFAIVIPLIAVGVWQIKRSTKENASYLPMPAKICDMLRIDAHKHFDFEFSSVSELVERLKKTDYERLKTLFDTLAGKLSQKTDADVYVFDNSGDMLACFPQAENENCKLQSF